MKKIIKKILQNNNFKTWIGKKFIDELNDNLIDLQDKNKHKNKNRIANTIKGFGFAEIIQILYDIRKNTYQSYIYFKK